jgi:hypothetical protein
MNTKLEALRALLESQQRARLLAEGMRQDLLDSGNTYFATLKMGKKYCNVDFGGSGKYMVDLATEEIFGIKAYGKIHRGHRYGTLDTINEYDWSDYTAVLMDKAFVQHAEELTERLREGLGIRWEQS